MGACHGKASPISPAGGARVRPGGTKPLGRTQPRPITLAAFITLPNPQGRICLQRSTATALYGLPPVDYRRPGAKLAHASIRAGAWERITDFLSTSYWQNA